MGNAFSLERLVYPGHVNLRAKHELRKLGFSVSEICASITANRYEFDTTAAIFHGNLEDFAQVAPVWQRVDSKNIVGFEYPGYGWRVDEVASQKAVLADVQEQVEFLQTYDKVIVFGRSLGTFAAIKLALALGPSKCIGMVLMSPMLTAIATKITPPMHRAFGLFDYIDNETTAKKLDADLPVLILHGTDDTIVPVSHGRALMDIIPSARYIEFPGVGHNDLCLKNDVWDTIKEFMRINCL